MRKSALLASVALLAAGPALAQLPGPTQSRSLGENIAPMPGNQAEAVATAEFVRLAGMSDMYELQASRLAEQQAQASEVRDFARHMLREHQRTNAALQGLMQRLGSSVAGQLPQTLDQQHMEMVRQLQGARGAAFDRLYVTQQLVAHQQAVELFQNYGQQGENTPLRQWAAAALPGLRQHLEQARQLQRGMAGQGGGTGG